jgi:hypothetical protein
LSCAALLFVLSCWLIFHAMSLLNLVEIVPQKPLTPTYYWGTVIT